MNATAEGALERVLQESGNIDNFIDTFFSFLARRTDFFMECPAEGGRFGFPAGHAEALVRSTFKKWQNRAKEGTKPVANAPPSAASYSSIESATASIQEDDISRIKEVTLSEDGSIQIKSSDSPPPPKPKAIKPPEKSKDPQSTSASEAYNGRITDKYAWSQSILEVDVKIPVTADIKRGKQVQVKIDTNSIRVNLAGATEPIVEGSLKFPVKKDDSYWNLIPGEAIHIFLQKAQERWWLALLEGEDLLEMSQIEAVRPMEDLDEEEQMKLQEVCWNEERKRQGLPTSEQMKMEKVLKNAWNAADSPFKGQPFDPALVQIGNQGTFPSQPSDNSSNLS